MRPRSKCQSKPMKRVPTQAPTKPTRLAALALARGGSPRASSGPVAEKTHTRAVLSSQSIGSPMPRRARKLISAGVRIHERGAAGPRRPAMSGTIAIRTKMRKTCATATRGMSAPVPCAAMKT